ncbi:MAG TPA: MG2 domain-containing protein, partial [Polyangia bacterium]|nr:MG2 domain-containing protein [Polyangia bacterium]
QPARPLALATKWRVACDERLTGAEGPLPMQPIAPDASAASRPELALETYGPMKLVAVEPHGQDVDPDRAAIVVRFSNPLAGDAKSVPITIQPAPEGSADGASLNDNEWRFSARGLAPNTEYRVSAPAGIKDEFGQATAEPLAASFRTIEPSPRFDLTTGSWVVEAARGAYVLWARNLTRLDVAAAAVSEAELPGLLPQLNWWDDESVDLAKLKTSKQLTLDATGPRNRWHQVQLDPKHFFGPRRATGFFYFAVSSPEEPLPRNSEKPRVREALINVTNLGVTAKLAAGSGLVWVTRLDSGAPVPGAEVAIRDRSGKTKWKGRTGADGMVETPGRAKLQPPAPARPVPAEDEGEGEGEGDGEEMGEGPSRGLLVFARLGSDVTFVDPERGGAFEAWNFGASPDRSGHLESLRGFAHTDRGLYRPGDTVHLRGLVRSMRLGQGLRVPTGKRAVAVEVRDPRGGTLFRKRAALSRYGSWSLDVRLPGEARLGDYAILASLPEGSFREHFSVEEYRAATFESKVASLAPRYVVGEELRMKVESRYLYGAPLRGGKVTWRLYHRERAADFAGHPGYSFSDDVQGSDRAFATPTEDLLSEKEDKLDKSGRNELRLRLPRGALPGDRELTVAAQVEDDTHQSVTATAVVPVHPARVAFGVAASGPLMTAGKPSRVKVIAVDPSGKRIEGQARVVFRKIEWSCVWEEFGYRGSYRCDKKESDVLTRALVVPAAEPGDLTLEPPAAGEYALVIEGKDGQGNPTRTSRFFWVAGPGESPWQVDDSGRFGIVADKPRYQPGDVARLLLRTSLSGATALVTIEREGVLERRMVVLPPAGEALEVPIRDAYAPNVYVSVLLVRGRTGKGARGMPFVRMGLVNLPVESGHKRLKVEVSTDQASYRPGGKVTAQVRLTDADGK